MIIVVHPSRCDGQIDAPPSKSYAHRMLIAAALSLEPVEIITDSASRDFNATLGGVKRFASVIKSDRGYVICRDGGREEDESKVIDCDESGSTLRFLLPVISALGCRTSFIGKGGLASRPIAELLEVLREHGATVYGDKLPFTVDGAISCGNFRIRGDISSQYLSGLLLALPLLKGDSRIEIEGECVSLPYLNITLDVLKKFGISIQKTDSGFYVPGGQSYLSPGKIKVPGDWSGAAFPLIGGILGGTARVGGLEADCQGDAAIVDILRAMGGKITFDCGIYIAQKSDLDAIELDAGDVPDLVPVVAAAMAMAKGKSIIYNAERLRHKECDRLEATVNMLKALGIHASACGGRIEIVGGGLCGGKVDTMNDHRMVMAAMTAAFAASGDVYIDGAEAAAKSYPEFFKHYKQLGGRYDERIRHDQTK